MEDQVRRSALQALASWQKGETTCETVHAQCAFMIKFDGGKDSSDEFVSFLQDERPETFLEPTATPHITYVKVLPVGQQSAASVTVAVGRLMGCIVMLRESDTWKAISVALSASQLQQQQQPVLPDHFTAVADLTWKGYCHASRVCDGALMAESFHKTCRLTYSLMGKSIQIVNQPRFCEMVQHRYTAEDLPHKPFSHLLHLPLLSSCDSLQAIEFVTPELAIVTLKVGHPPFLWTDLLTCALLEEGRWWIVHKSSENEPFLVDRALAVSST